MRHIRTKRLRERRRERLANAAVLGLAFSGALVLLASQASMLPALRISAIVVEGAHRTSQRELALLAHERIHGNYLDLFSRSNIFLAPRGAIEHAILAAYPRIASVEARTGLSGQLRVSVVERVAVARYCERGGCFDIDESGFVFAKTDQEKSTSQFIYLRARTGDGSPVGLRFLPPEEFRALAAFIAAVRALGISATEASVKSPRRYELAFGDPRIIFDPADGYEAILERLRAVLRSEIFRAPDAFDTLDYLDLRFGNKLFYKFRE